MLLIAKKTKVTGVIETEVSEEKKRVTKENQLRKEMKAHKKIGECPIMQSRAR
jgi:hypothetical protein